MSSNATAARRRSQLASQYAKQNYGSQKTIGPRQVSVIYDVFVANKNGMNCSLVVLKSRHPSIESVIVTLLGRGLIKKARGKGRCFEVTAKGFTIGMMVDRSGIAPGLGLVATNVPFKG
jgi:predicted transcriptional regulator